MGWNQKEPLGGERVPRKAGQRFDPFAVPFFVGRDGRPRRETASDLGVDPRTLYKSLEGRSASAEEVQ